MKSTTCLALFGLISGALAQSLAPSPTESFGCEPHDDHWHCEGPRTDDSAVSATTTPPATTPTPDDDHDGDDHDGDDHDDDEHDHDEGTGVLPPSPTESVGCEPHGDHWHCEGPATAVEPTGFTTETSTTTSPPDADEEAATTAPSPTATAGAARGASLAFGPVAVLAVFGALL